MYVFEFKIRGTSEEALAQIEEKGGAAGYDIPRRADGVVRSDVG